jgi:hypothetical protein
LLCEFSASILCVLLGGVGDKYLEDITRLISFGKFIEMAGLKTSKKMNANHSVLCILRGLSTFSYFVLLRGALLRRMSKMQLHLILMCY